MKLVIRTPVSQRRLIIEKSDDLDQAIRKAFSIEEYRLFSDPKRTQPFDPATLDPNSEESQMIYMSYDVPEPKVHKEKNTCTHSPDAICPKCASLDPFDRKFTEDVKVKYLSYASYREMLRNSSKNEDEYDYSRKVCDSHPQNVTCTRCMDKVITLAPQIFRRVDYVEFDNKDCLEAFIGRWRESKRQFIGLLVGTYEDHAAVPLGRKAVVSGIWQIEQENFPDGAVLQCIPKEFLCKELQLLGVVYTDLFMRDGAMFSYKQDYIISAMELNFIYEIQAIVGNPDFVGICVTTSESLDIVPECYMLSAQFLGLMRARALTLTTKRTDFATSRDISYLVQNEYGKAVPVKAQPLVPVDYFVVKCEIGHKECPLFPNPTVIERCTLRKLSGYFAGNFGFEKFRSFNVLVSLARHLKATGEIFSAVVANDRERFDEASKCDEFVAFCAELEKYNETKWGCAACTYKNEPFADHCEMCGNTK